MKRGTKRTPGGRRRPQRGDVHPRRAGDPQLGVLDPPPCLAAASRCPCTGASGRSRGPRACPSRTAAVRPGRRPRRLKPRRPPGARTPRAGSRARAAGSTPSSPVRRARPCSECTTIASKWSYRRRCAARCPGRASRGRMSCAVSTQRRRAPRAAVGGGAGAGGQQQAVEVLHGEPLEVHDVGGARGAPVAQHVGHVLGELDRAARARLGHARGDTVEQLASTIAVGGRHRPVREAARVQLDVGSGRAQRTAERVVVGRRVGRGIDDVDAHWRASERRAQASASGRT